MKYPGKIGNASATFPGFPTNQRPPSLQLLTESSSYKTFWNLSDLFDFRHVVLENRGLHHHHLGELQLTTYLSQ